MGFSFNTHNLKMTLPVFFFFFTPEDIKENCLVGSVVSMILTSCPSIRVWSPQSGSRIISPNILHHATTGRKQRSCSYTHAHVCLPERSFVESLLRESLTQEVELTCSSKNTFYSRQRPRAQTAAINTEL